MAGLVSGTLLVVIHAAVIAAPSVRDDETPGPLCVVAEIINPQTELFEFVAGYWIRVLNLKQPKRLYFCCHEIHVAKERSAVTVRHIANVDCLGEGRTARIALDDLIVCVSLAPARLKHASQESSVSNTWYKPANRVFRVVFNASSHK